MLFYPFCHFPVWPNITQFGNLMWINSHHCHSWHFHSVRFFQSGELLFVFTATVKHHAAPWPDSYCRNLTELLCITQAAHAQIAHGTFFTHTHVETKFHPALVEMEMSHAMTTENKGSSWNVHAQKHWLVMTTLLTAFALHLSFLRSAMLRNNK